VDPSRADRFANVSDRDRRSQKRQKPNTSSSSSGANSDEMPEQPSSTAELIGAKTRANISSGLKPPTGQQQHSTKMQQRKKSKSSESGGSSAESGDQTSTPATNNTYGGSPMAYGSVRAGTPQSNSSTAPMHAPVRPSTPVSRPVQVPLPSKGRGQHYFKMEPPPGFEGK
jgi:hypothetical protein